MKDAFARGTGFHDLLYLYYKSVIKGLSKEKAIKNAFRYMKYQKGMTTVHIQQVLPKILQYFAYYQFETWIPLQAEIGFSKLLYEDDHHQFIYQGKIDLLMEVQKVNAFVDHKTQAWAKSLVQESNQFIGYSWATGWRMGIINYINLSPSLAPKDAFRRQIMNFTPQMIEEWKDNAIETFLQLAGDIRRERFNKRRAGCLGAYGICDFEEVCRQTSKLVQIGMLDKLFVKKEEWSPWE